MIGTRALARDIACAIICPLGALRAPPIVCQIVPPTKPEIEELNKINA